MCGWQGHWQHQGDSADGACVPVGTFEGICIRTDILRLHSVPCTDFHNVWMLVWQSAVESVFASNLFNRWTISRRPEMNTYSWPAQHHGAQTICEKLCDCVLCLGWGSELHLREQQNWLLVQRLLWASCYTSLWPFLKLAASVLLPETRLRL